MAPNQTYDVYVSCCVYTHTHISSSAVVDVPRRTNNPRGVWLRAGATTLLLPNWTECCRVKVLYREYIIQVAVNTFPESSLLVLHARSKRDQETMNSPISLNQYDQPHDRAGRGG